MIEVELPAAVEVLRQGGLLIYPTETVYGLGVDISRPEAVEALYQLKGREAQKAVSLLVSSPAQIKNLVSQLSNNTLNLIKKFLPGPLTLVLPASERVPAGLCSGGGWVGIRWSSHPLAQALVETFGKPITTTSANPSGAPSVRSSAELRRYFGENKTISCLSGGDLPPSRGSTVVKVHANRLELLREGDVSFAALESTFGAGAS